MELNKRELEPETKLRTIQTLAADVLKKGTSFDWPDGSEPFTLTTLQARELADHLIGRDEALDVILAIAGGVPKGKTPPATPPQGHPRPR